MWQRIQTLYLLIASGLLVAMYFQPYGTGFIILFSIALAAQLLAIVALKSRTLQMRLSNLAALLLLGLLAAPHLAGVINVPKKTLMPIVALLCVIGAYACRGRIFDIGVMLVFGVLGFFMRTRGYPVAPMTLALVLGGMMDSNFRRAVSLASSEDHMLRAMFGRPMTLALLALTLFSLAAGLPAVKKLRKQETE